MSDYDDLPEPIDEVLEPETAAATAAATAPETPWIQGQIIEVLITGLSDSGDGVGRSGNRVVFVPDTVTGDRVEVRLMHVRPAYANAQVVVLLEPSPHRINPSCIVADKCGGCQWQHVSDAYQQVAKRLQVVDALERIGQFVDPPVVESLPIELTLGYRNKVTYPLAMSSSRQVQAGYYRQGSHRLVNLNQCPAQDLRLDPLLADLKQDIQTRRWSIYDEKTHEGRIRHLGLRIGRRTGQILVTLIVTDWAVKEIEEQAKAWMEKYPAIVGVCLNRNREKTNIIFGTHNRCIAGRAFLEEEFAGLTFEIGPNTFFQIHTDQAEAMLQRILDELALTGSETVIDAYCGIGTLSLPIARRVKQLIGIEVQRSAVEQARQNAIRNNITNVEFQIGAAEAILPKMDFAADIVVLDPPRKGCDRAVLDSLLIHRPKRIVYMSCKPATFARDLQILCAGGYHLRLVQPGDFFPQTAHVEAVAFLDRVD
jgi:23S rRNA (uracil1939-C5)-methyltransferase